LLDRYLAAKQVTPEHAAELVEEAGKIMAAGETP
jgi:hypothetical protein